MHSLEGRLLQAIIIAGFLYAAASLLLRLHTSASSDRSATPQLAASAVPALELPVDDPLELLPELELPLESLESLEPLEPLEALLHSPEVATETLAACATQGLG
mmetsp:Transcript_11532/g.46634  ORF Transcript_11532/g.46634 Transcript_11532/m.46634 type:complete len:104 (+) Transcript_11532:2040-2351(+)